MNNGRKAYDVTALIEPIPFKAGAYEFTLPPDLSLPTIADIQREMAFFQKALEQEGVDVQRTEDKLWQVFENLMENADPQPTRPVRKVKDNGGIFTTSAMTTILGFLLTEWGEARSSMTSSQSPTSSTVPSASGNSSAAPVSTEAPSA